MPTKKYLDDFGKFKYYTKMILYINQFGHWLQVAHIQESFELG